MSTSYRAIACLLIALSGSGGCATIAHRWNQTVLVTSEPSGAQVFVDDHLKGFTPIRMTFSRRSAPPPIRLEMPGYHPSHVHLKRGISAWLLADAALALNPAAGQGLSSPSQYPALVGTTLAFTLGIDFLTGAAFTLPSTIAVAMLAIR